MTSPPTTPPGSLPSWSAPVRPEPGEFPPLDAPDYASTARRHPNRPPVRVDPDLLDATELTGPLFTPGAVAETEADLTTGPNGTAVGQRITVTGRLLDSAGRAIPDSLIEVWQANASGRYAHAGDTWPGTLDPNFVGAGRVLTDATGTYRFTTVKPGAYPWGNHPNAWRPAHIHLSVFGRAVTQRLVTQMYFPDDPLFFQDPILNSIADPAARRRLVARYDHGLTQPEWALGFRFDIVVRGPRATPFEAGAGAPAGRSERPAGHD
ncbi:MAG: protocatechuate 3,4-dioxygenase subunit beta [Acidimicrobiales bacterium]